MRKVTQDGLGNNPKEKGNVDSETGLLVLICFHIYSTMIKTPVDSYDGSCGDI